MTASTPSLFRALRRYAGKIQTMRDDMRTKRVMNGLPESIRKDIGWPDLYTDRRAGRG
jgi:hypothetical protein